MMNKKAQNSTIGVVIAIVLGVALIVFLIWGFSSNWSMFRSTSDAYVGDDMNVAKDACRYQCEGGLESEFCSGTKSVTLANGTKAQRTCKQLEVNCPTITCPTQ